MRKKNPAKVTNCSGKDEKAVMPVSAKRKRRKKDQPVCPPARRATSKGICTRVKPGHAVIPRKKTFRSCISSQASSDLRFINLKSDAPFNSNPESLFQIK